MREMVSQCPICDGQEFKIVKVKCDNCGTQIEGSFSISRLGNLSKEHREFIEVFIKSRGNIKDVEKVLGISYPTVRSRLDSVIQALGYETVDTSNRNKEILKALEREEITPEEALRKLEEGKG